MIFWIVFWGMHRWILTRSGWGPRVWNKESLGTNRPSPICKTSWPSVVLTRASLERLARLGLSTQHYSPIMALLYRGESRKKILRHPIFWMKIAEIVSEAFSLSRVHRTEVSVCSHLSLQVSQKCSLLGKLTSSCNINYLSDINLFVGNLLVPAFCNTCYILRLCNFLNRQRAGIRARKTRTSRAGFL